MTYSATQVRKAGDTLRTMWRTPRAERWLTPELERAFQVLDAYRAEHQRALTTATMGLRSMVATVQKKMTLAFLLKEPPRGVVSQRLKRHFSIVKKLANEPTMQLTTMQDIAGCRAVVSGLTAVYQLRERLIRTGRVRREYGYITQPKASGYRALHEIVTYDDRRVEVQLRTEVQHEWAITIERVGGRIGEDLKGSHGPDEVLRFFELVSEAMALEEDGRQPSEDLLAAIRAARQRAEPFLMRSGTS
jgi:ppGpp synthetase/RelA/SpoT-type nucleotidyltranferase